MPVREFTDQSRREWRAWDLKPENIHPATKGEDYLADCYITGWIVFETFSGDEKRRLCPWPIDWVTRTDDQLCDLLRMAEVVPQTRVKADRISRRQEVPSAIERVVTPAMGSDIDITDLQVIRTFRYPGGRLWTVSVLPHPAGGGSAVLRFTAGASNIDLDEWPKDWADQQDEALVWMLRRASPRSDAHLTATDIPRRRWDDAAAERFPGI